MSAFGEAKKIWAAVNIGEGITSEQLIIKAGVEPTENNRKSFSSFLCQMVKKGEAQRDGKGGKHILYVKSNGVPLKPKPLEEKSYSMLELGEAVFEVVQGLRRTVEFLRVQLKEEKSLVREMTDQKAKIEQMLKDSQTRILELNSTKQKSFRLADVQEFRNKLPEA